mmetsp:Transcript_20697/g.41301  ORF Transcript_20697/g.41301 Transcript_20697/m.41301 type:complete len:93 (-) Transcript_20697:22-300(-)
MQGRKRRGEKETNDSHRNDTKEARKKKLQKGETLRDPAIFNRRDGTEKKGRKSQSSTWYPRSSCCAHRGSRQRDMQRDGTREGAPIDGLEPK